MTVSSGWAWDATFSACGDLSSKQYHFVRPAGTAKRVEGALGASGPAPLGVLQDDPTSLQECVVRIQGSTQLSVNATTAIAYGDFLTAGSDGQGEVTTGCAFHAMALEALASGSGVKIEAMLLPHGAYLADNTP